MLSARRRFPLKDGNSSDEDGNGGSKSDEDGKDGSNSDEVEEDGDGNFGEFMAISLARIRKCKLLLPGIGIVHFRQYKIH